MGVLRYKVMVPSDPRSRRNHLICKLSAPTHLRSRQVSQTRLRLKPITEKTLADSQTLCVKLPRLKGTQVGLKCECRRVSKENSNSDWDDGQVPI
jgi:hypothetical protein